MALQNEMASRPFFKVTQISIGLIHSRIRSLPHIENRRDTTFSAVSVDSSASVSS